MIRKHDPTRPATARIVAIATILVVVADVVMDEACVPLYHNHYVGGYRLSKRLLEEDLER